MKSTLLSLVLLAGTFLGGLAIGVLISVALTLCGVPEGLATSIGTLIWLTLVVVGISYGSLWIDPPGNRPLRAKEESKLRTAELRCAVVFGLLGGAMGSAANLPTAIVVIVTIAWASVGALVGYDIKRRVMKARTNARRANNA
jgi:hypothetical protein